MCIRDRQYFVTIVDEYSIFVHVKPIRNKTQASNSVREFFKWFEKQSNPPVLSLHTNGGTEFFEVQKDLKKESTDITYTTAYTPQSNGLAERCHGVVLAQSRAILGQSKLPIRFWNYAVLHAVKCKTVSYTHLTLPTIYSV